MKEIKEGHGRGPDRYRRYPRLYQRLKIKRVRKWFRNPSAMKLAVYGVLSRTTGYPGVCVQTYHDKDGALLLHVTALPLTFAMIEDELKQLRKSLTYSQKEERKAKK